MANMLVVYQGPNPALSTLVAELRDTFGKPARTYEFVTGYKSPANISGHNADANGRVHSVDIFIGPGNLTEAQGIWVAEQLRREGKRGSIPGHPDRLAYIIHRGQIAGDHTGWEWAPYTGKDWHGDHIHVSSVFDYYWGDAVAGNPADYNSTAPWGIGKPALTQQSESVTPITAQPIQEDDMPLNAEDKEFIQDEIERRHVVTRDVIRASGFSDANKLFIQTAVEVRAVVTRDVIKSAVGTLAQFTPGIDADKLEMAMQDAVAKAVKEGLAEGINVDVTVGGSK